MMDHVVWLMSQVPIPVEPTTNWIDRVFDLGGNAVISLVVIWLILGKFLPSINRQSQEQLTSFHLEQNKTRQSFIEQMVEERKYRETLMDKIAKEMRDGRRDDQSLALELKQLIAEMRDLNLQLVSLIRDLNLRPRSDTHGT